MSQATTTVAISGGGPAGVMLGLLLARRGVDVTVLEQHADFLRDFRGDTVHPSTQVVLQQLGLLDAFRGIQHGRMTAVDFSTSDGPLLHQELAAVRPRHPFHEIAIAPQWDLLDLLVQHASRYPAFHLVMEAETVGVVRERGAVRGLRYRRDGVEHVLRAVLTVDAEGRRSTIRDEVGSPVVDLGSAIDVLWFRLPHEPGDEPTLRGVIGRGGAVVAIDRADYWQLALIVPKGSDAGIRAAGLPAFRSRIAGIASWTADRVDALTSWDDVKLLSVGIDRLVRWSGPGLLAIGDAAHTMSPVGGVGINLAIGDAVAAANLLTPHLLAAQADPRRFERTLNPALLRRVQRRRQLPARVTQAVQTRAQDAVLARTRIPEGVPLTPPPLVRALLRSPLTRLVPQVFVYGVRPERLTT